MTIITTYKSSSGSTSVNDIIYNDETPNIKSLASLVLLNDYYHYLDVDYVDERKELIKYLRLRQKFLKRVLNKKRVLVCHYCGKSHLDIGYEDMKLAYLNNTNKNLATIDHKIPRKICDNPLDTKNWLVSCKKCNREKGDMNYDEYINLKNIQHVY